MWWTDEKIDFYDRAASASDFHRRLADLLEPYLGQAASIAELGCGLGFMTAQLTDRGHAVTGYDSDQRAISWAARRFPFSAFRCRDCYSLGLVADTSIAVFFGRLTSDDNCERLLETCSRRLIYVDNEHEEYEGCSWKHFQKTEDFLRQKGLSSVLTRYSPHAQSLRTTSESTTRSVHGNSAGPLSKRVA